MNFNEHTIVLTGIDATGQITAVNVLHGTLETYSPAQFEAMWQLLG